MPHSKNRQEHGNGNGNFNDLNGHHDPNSHLNAVPRGNGYQALSIPMPISSSASRLLSTNKSAEDHTHHNGTYRSRSESPAVVDNRPSKHVQHQKSSSSTSPQISFSSVLQKDNNPNKGKAKSIHIPSRSVPNSRPSSTPSTPGESGKYNNFHTVQYGDLGGLFPLSSSKHTALSNHSGKSPQDNQQRGYFDMSIFEPYQNPASTRQSIDHDQRISRRTLTREPSIESFNSADSVPFLPPPPPPPSGWKRFTNKFTNRVIKRNIKFVIALYLGALMALVEPIARHLLPTPYLVLISIVFMHPSRTVGAQLEVTVFSMIGVIFSIIWAIPCQAVVAAYNQEHYSGGISPAWAIAASWFFIGIWVMTTMKTIYAKLTFTALVFSIILGFCLTENTTSSSLIFQLNYMWDIIKPLLIGIGLSQAVNILFWPEAANQSLGRALNESLDSSRALLNLSTRSFLLNHKTIALPKSAMETAQNELQTAQRKLFTAYKEARYELTYSFIDPAEYKPVRLILSTMMRHLGSMSLVVQNERLLMLGDSDNSLNFLSQSNSECDSSEDDTDGETGTENGNWPSGYNSVSRSSFHESGGLFQSPVDSPRNSCPSSRHQDHSLNGTSEDCTRRRSTQLKRKDSTAEIRRIRQLLQRAENSTQSAIAAKRHQQEKMQRVALEQAQHIFDPSRGGISTDPTTPSAGQKPSIFDSHHLHRTKHQDQSIGSYEESYPSIRRLYRSNHPSPYSSRPNSIHEAQNQDTAKSFKSLFSAISKSPFKTNRPASLKAGFNVNNEMINKEILDNSRDASRHPSAENLFRTSELEPHPLVDTLQNFSKYQSSVDGPFPRASITDQQSKKAAEALKKRRRKEARDEREKNKRAAKEEKRRNQRTENEKRADAAVGTVLDKEVAHGDRKLFMSFLDIVRDPIQRLSDTCSKVMVAMEKDIVSGLSAENDRLERIRIRNSQRADAIRAADVVAAAEEKTNTVNKSSERLEGVPKDGEEDGSKTPPSISGLSKFLVSIGFRRPQLTADDIAYAKVLKASMQREAEKAKDDMKNRATPDLGNSSQKDAAISGIDADDDFKLPPNVSYSQFMAEELEIFDRAEANGLQNFIYSHPTLDVGPREELFLIFFFMFAIREIACELLCLGNLIDKLDQQELENMKLENRIKPKKKLWWPKVMGNFSRWFSWGSYSQLKTGEGLGSLTLSTTKKMDSKQPRSIAEERAILEAKAAKTAEEKRTTEAAAKKEEVHNGAVFRGRRKSDSWGVLCKTDSLPANFPHARKSLEENTLRQRYQGNSHESPLVLFSSEIGHTVHSLKTDNHNLKSHNSESVRFGPTTTSSNPSDPGLLSLASKSSDNAKNHSQHHTTEQEAYNLNLAPKRETKHSQHYTIVDIPDYKDLHPKLSKGQKQYEDEDVKAIDFTSFPAVAIHHGTIPELGSLRNLESEENSIPESISGIDVSTKIIQAESSSDNNKKRNGGHESEAEKFTRKRNQDPGANVSWLSKIFPAPSQRNDEQDKKTSAVRKSIPPATAKKKTKLRFRIWQMLQPFKTYEVQFGFKMALGLTLCGLLTWLDIRSKFLVTDHGQWSMMTVLAVLTPTVGATVSIGLMRMLGTVVGVGWAILTFIADPYNPYVIGAMMLPNFVVSVYLMLLTPHPKLGLIICLSYASITFSMYGRRTQDSVYEMAYKRAATVIIGLTIALVLNSLLWPILARRQLRLEIASLIRSQGVLLADIINKLLHVDPSSCESELLFGDIMQHVDGDEDSDINIVNSDSEYHLINNSFVERAETQRASQEDGINYKHPDYVKKKSTLSRKVDDPERLAFQHVEQKLQTKMMKILELFSLSQSEPKLKEEFPEALYKKIIKCCQNILDRLVSMRMAAQLLSPDVRRLISGPISIYRRDMVGALLLNFSILSSSLQSKSPLPPYLPSARMARLRLIYNVREVISSHQQATGRDHYTYIYYYAFSAALEEVIEELELLAILIKPLVGVTMVIDGDFGSNNQQMLDSKASGSFTRNFEADDSSNHPQSQTLIPSSALSSGRSGLSPNGSIYDEGIHNLRRRVQNRHKEQLAENQVDIYRRLLQEKQQQSELLLQQIREQQKLIQEQQLLLEQQQQQQQQKQEGISDENILTPKIVIDASLSSAHPANQSTFTIANPLPTAKHPEAIVESSNSRGINQIVLRSPPFPATMAAAVRANSLLKDQLPIVVMDESILETRQKQRFQEAMQLAQEVSGEQINETQTSILPTDTHIHQVTKRTKGSG